MLTQQVVQQPINSSNKNKRLKSIHKRMSRIEIIQNLAEKTGLKRVEVDSVFEHLSHLVKSHLQLSGSGEFLIPKLGVKIKRVRRKPTKTRTTVSPLTQSEVVIPSKPERWDIKVVLLKVLKESLI